MRTILLTLVLGTAATACVVNRAEDRIKRHAATVLGAAPGALRVTSETQLTGARHDFSLVTAPSGDSLLVVSASNGEIFDSRTPGAFDKVSKAEHATERLSQLGAERVASWFGALGGGACAPPPVDQAHFAEVSHQADGAVEIRYLAGVDRVQGVKHTCVFVLAADGSLKSAQTLETSAPSATAPTWHE